MCMGITRYMLHARGAGGRSCALSHLRPLYVDVAAVKTVRVGYIVCERTSRGEVLWCCGSAGTSMKIVILPWSLYGIYCAF